MTLVNCIQVEPNGEDSPAASCVNMHVAEAPSQVLVYDFFSGCGGTSAGLRKAGMKPLVAVDIDGQALQTYEANFKETMTFKVDIRELSTRDLEPLLDRDRRQPVLFSA